jgi:hypothetical protein
MFLVTHQFSKCSPDYFLCNTEEEANSKANSFGRSGSTEILEVSYEYLYFKLLKELESRTFREAIETIEVFKQDQEYCRQYR